MRLVKVSTGIGTGIVINGRSYTGADGGAGDIGHVRLAGHDDVGAEAGQHAIGESVLFLLGKVRREAKQGGVIVRGVAA